MMQRLLFIILIFVGACTSSRKFTDYDLNSPYVEYGSVKLKLNTKDFEDVALNGFIYLHKDSLICFKFYKTVFKVVSGYYSSDFQIYDHINKELHTDVLKQMIAKTGMVLNDKVVHSLFMGNTKILVSTLKTLNGDAIKVNSSESKKRKSITIFNPARKSEMLITFVYQGNVLRTIEMEFNGAAENWRVAMEILKVSNNQRNCNFDF